MLIIALALSTVVLFIALGRVVDALNVKQLEEDDILRELQAMRSMMETSRPRKPASVTGIATRKDTVVVHRAAFEDRETRRTAA